ncbi:MAG: DUF86 domain-containing protein [Anaerolineae bacterium]
MRPEKLYLTDIAEAARAIERFLTGIDSDEFEIDDLRQSAILQKLTIIGEAAARLPAEFRASHGQIEWRDIIAFRNIAVHEYFAVDWSIVWVAATQDAPKLRAQVEAILASEFVEPDDAKAEND